MKIKKTIRWWFVPLCLLVLTTPWFLGNQFMSGWKFADSPNAQYKAKLMGCKCFNPLSKDFLKVRGIASVTDLSGKTIFESQIESGAIDHPLGYRENDTIAILWNDTSTTVEFKSVTTNVIIDVTK